MVKDFIKKTPFIHIWRLVKWILIDRRVTEGRSTLNILKTFPLFEAHGWGLYPIRSKLTIQSVNQVVPALSDLCEISVNNITFKSELESYINVSEDAIKLGEFFDKYGSDKASLHDYNLLYAGILNQVGNVEKIFEIGLGTNNTDIVSTMGKKGNPGASLRAFRDFLPNVQVYGADFDRSVLFTEDRIETCFVDQTSKGTFAPVGDLIGSEFSLMIDDGLHSPNANLHSLNFFLPRLKVGGFAVIEDINGLTKDMWKIVSALLPVTFKSAFIQTKAASVFVVQRVG